MWNTCLELVTAQMDKLLLGCLVLLVILSALQLRRLKKTNRQFEYLTDKLTGYLKEVLLEEDELPEEAPVVSRQEKNMRESIEKQQRRTNAKDAQVIDAVLSEIFP